jgi:phage-related minor tail protein
LKKRAVESLRSSSPVRCTDLAHTLHKNSSPPIDPELAIDLAITMSSIVKAFSDLVGSIFEIFTSIIHTIFSFVQSIFAMAGSLVSDFARLLGGTINFLFCMCKHVIKHFLKLLRVSTANIIIIVGLVAAFFAYVLYTQRQSKPISAKKSS